MLTRSGSKTHLKPLEIVWPPFLLFRS
jgi:hypothetical protein